MHGAPQIDLDLNRKSRAGLLCSERIFFPCSKVLYLGTQLSRGFGYLLYLLAGKKQGCLAGKPSDRRDMDTQEGGS
jgi:hypothetical protein